MSEEQKDGTPEPTMEEILSSIRRIISDEDQPGAPGPGVSAAASPASPDFTPNAASEPFDAAVLDQQEPLNAESEDVLELTQIVNEDGTVTDIDALMREPEPEPVFEREPPSAVAPPPGARLRAEPAASPAPIMDEAVANMAAAALNQLVVEMPKYVGIGQGLTLEEITKELLRPMLKQWLDAHLPATVERLVREEIARVSRLHN